MHTESKQLDMFGQFDTVTQKDMFELSEVLARIPNHQGLSNVAIDALWEDRVTLTKPWVVPSPDQPINRQMFFQLQVCSLMTGHLTEFILQPITRLSVIVESFVERSFLLDYPNPNYINNIIIVLKPVFDLSLLERLYPDDRPSEIPKNVAKFLATSRRIYARSLSIDAMEIVYRFLEHFVVLHKQIVNR